MVLQARDVETDALVAQMVQAEARRSDFEEKMLEIEETEDNHIAYLEAQLRTCHWQKRTGRWRMSLKAKGLRSRKDFDA